MQDDFTRFNERKFACQSGKAHIICGMLILLVQGKRSFKSSLLIWTSPSIGWPLSCQIFATNLKVLPSPLSHNLRKRSK